MLAPVTDYLLPNQPSLEELVSKAPISTSLFYEYWSRAYDKTYFNRILQKTAAVDSQHFPSRRVLKKKTLQVGNLPESLDAPDAIFEITIVGVQRPAPGPEGPLTPQQNRTRPQFRSEEAR
jgi:hypothetical protein